MKISSFHILFLILIYPFFYASSYITFNIGYLFSVYYFVPVTFFLILLNLGKKSTETLKQNALNIGLLLVVILLVLFNTTDLRYSKPLVFFIFVLNIYILCLTLKMNINNKLLQSSFFLLLILSFLFITQEDRYFDYRYLSFFLSPTVFSVYTEVFLILVLCFSKNRQLKIVLFLLAGFFILLTKTRLNFFFYLTIPIMLYYSDKFYKSKFKIILIYLVCLNLLYPIYNFIIQSEVGKNSLVTSRYENGRDASFGLRNYLNTLVYKDYISNSTVSEKILGRGSEVSRKILIANLGEDVLPHNDFIRFTLDFGLLATLVFIIFLYRVTRKNYVSFILLLLYLFSFYHNMIYDFFMIALMMYFSNVNENDIAGENLIIADND